MPPELKGNKVTTIPAGPAGLGSVLDAAMRDEPAPTPEALRLIEEAQKNGPTLPLTGALGGSQPGGAPDLSAAAPGPGPGLLSETDPATAAATAVALFVAGGAVVGGDEWAPDSAAELAELEAAFTRYFEIRGAPRLPPELIVLAAVGKYTGRRMVRPQTRGRLAAWLAPVPILGRMLARPVTEIEIPAPAAAVKTSHTAAAAGTDDDEPHRDGGHNPAHVGPFLRG